MERKMRAVGFRRYGTAGVLEPLEVPKPGPEPDEVLVRVAAAGVNPADALLRSGRLRLISRPQLPFVPGADVAGVVEAAGETATRLEPGTAVFAMLPTLTGGGYAEYASVPERDAAPVPPGLTLAEAAGVPLAALTALQALRDEAGLRSGQHVLINGASGGVGTFAVGIAKALGARVTAASSGRNADLVRDLGADAFLDYTRGGVTAGEARYDAVFDAAGVHPFGRWRRTLRPRGVVVTVNPALGNPASKLLSRLTGGGRRLESVLVQPSGADLETVSAWISSGEIRPVVDRTYPFPEATDAHRRSETRRARGKIVLVVDEKLAGEKVPDRTNRPMG